MTPMKDELEESALSNIRLKLLDAIGRSIGGLRYHVIAGSKIISQGTTDAEGKIHEFQTQIGKPFTVEVERFVGRGMKKIREITPWTENFSVKLASSKILENTSLIEDKGTPGPYQRKTYTIQKGDTLSQIAEKTGTTADELAALNNIKTNATIFPGQTLKTPSHTKVISERSPSSPTIQLKNERGENGTPKTVASMTCQGACIQLGDTGPLVEELNIRLTGFGGSISSPSPLDEFTETTQEAVKQFQTDYMGTAPTGKACGSLLLALDDFLLKYPIHINAMKCPCGKCNGFGNGHKDSSSVGIFADKNRTTPINGIEHPGIHRALFWSLRAAMFYTRAKDLDLGFSLLTLSSGYRCWHNNAGYRKGHITSKQRTSTNHMGNALDLQFRRGSNPTRCSGGDLDEIRKKIFVRRLGAQMGWPEKNMLSLETTAQGATSWVHVDVRSYDERYKASRYYAATQAVADGDMMIHIAKREGRLALVACGGGIGHAPVRSKSQTFEERRPVNALSISRMGIEFIKGYEKCRLTPYDDSAHFCTIGWGHLIARKSCASIQDDDYFNAFRHGITQNTADAMLAQDIQTAEQIIKNRVQAPLFQHEYDALVSLIYNMGSFKKCPNLLSKLNTLDYSGCCNEFENITNGGVIGLIHRRAGEMNIFRHNTYNSSH